MAKVARLELRVELELLRQVDAARGDVSRTRFVERALETALSETKRSSGIEQAAPDLVGSSEPVRAAAPSRAPDVMSEPLAPSEKQFERRPPARPACPECGAAGPLHQRGCSRMK